MPEQLSFCLELSSQSMNESCFADPMNQDGSKDSKNSEEVKGRRNEKKCKKNENSIKQIVLHTLD